MKKFLVFFFSILTLFLTYLNREELIRIYAKYVKESSVISLNYKNNYYQDNNFNYVKQTDNFLITNSEQLLDVYYTIINSGIDEFYFYCDEEYLNCLQDVRAFSSDQEKLSNINAFVHPYNSFESIETTYNTFGKVEVKVNKTYSKHDIEIVNEKIKQIEENYIKNSTDIREVIKIAHDYIIDNTLYDSDKADRNITKYSSNTAYGPLIEGYAICSGYADAVAIFLINHDIPNFKVVSENHVWNAVLIDGKWLHLDATWDDPVMSDGSQIIDYSYFLITTDELFEQEQMQHNYDREVFSEI